MPSDLTAKQVAFAAHFVANGGNGADAAKAAGYADKSCRQEAYRLTRNPEVQAMVRGEQQRILGGRLASLALATLEQVMCDESAPAGARIDAARACLDRAGFSARAAQFEQADTGFAGMAIEDVQAFVVAGREKLAAMRAQIKTIEGEASPVH